MVKKVVIPVAGRGTRFLPATKEVAKEIIPILKTPMVHFVVQEAIDSGIEEIIFVTSKDKPELERYFSTNSDLENFLKKNNKNDELELVQKIASMVKIKSVVQDEQLGLGHAINCTKELVGDEDFAVLLADDLIMGEVPCMAQLMKVYRDHQAPVIGVMRVPKNETNKYGIVAGTAVNDSTFLMDTMVEKPRPEEAPSDMATPGRYILPSKIFSILDKIPRGSGGEYQLTDAINELCKEEKVYAHLFTGTRYDTGSIEGYLKATIDFALADEDLSHFAKKLIIDKAKEIS